MVEPNTVLSKTAFHPPPLGRGLLGGDVKCYYDTFMCQNTMKMWSLGYFAERLIFRRGFS